MNAKCMPYNKNNGLARCLLQDVKFIDKMNG